MKLNIEAGQFDNYLIIIQDTIEWHNLTYNNRNILYFHILNNIDNINLKF